MSKRPIHLPLQPGTNVAVLTALAHVIVTEGLVDEAFVRERCELDEFAEWAAFVAEERNSPEAVENVSGVPAELIRAAARLYATGGNAAIYYGLGVTEHSQGTTAVMAIANLAMATGNIGRPGVGVNPLRGQNNVQGSCDMGSFPHEFSGYRHVSDNATRAMFESLWGVALDAEPGLRIPNMLDAAVDGSFKGLYIQGEDIAQSDPDTRHIDRRPLGHGVRRRPGSLPERDGEFRACLPAGIDLSREGRDLHQRRAAHQPRPQGDGAARRVGGLGDHGRDRRGDGLHHALRPSFRDHGRDRAPDPDLRRRVLRQARDAAAPCSGRATRRRPKARRSCI